MSLRVEMRIEAGDWPAESALESLAARAVAAAADASGLAFAEAAEVSLLFTDDVGMRNLNAAWRGLDKATNVLSFASGAPVGEAMLLGDIALGCETARAEAEARHKPFAHHLAHLIVHGFLHLVGFDHEAEAEAERMEELERVILAQLGMEDPYRDVLCDELQ